MCICTCICACIYVLSLDIFIIQRDIVHTVYKPTFVNRIYISQSCIVDMSIYSVNCPIYLRPSGVNMNKLVKRVCFMTQLKRTNQRSASCLLVNIRTHSVANSLQNYRVRMRASMAMYDTGLKPQQKRDAIFFTRPKSHSAFWHHQISTSFQIQM